ncbi:MAG TPA: IPT/TIG domain-containing protein, partial [Acidimicrobiales bacterium]|nr:IPT/TIG domain-containing protein [Acidimicrobiales bacterium]
TALLGATTEPFSGIDTFVGLASGNTSFSAGGAGGLAFDASGTGNVLDLSNAPAGVTVKVNGDTPASPGAVTGLTAAGHDSFFGIQRLLGAVTIQSAVTTLPSSIPTGRINKAYSVQLTGTGGAGSYVDWHLQSGALAPGLTLSSSGLLAGTPTSSGKFTFEVGIESAGIPGGGTYVLTVKPPPPSVTSISPTHGKAHGGTVVTVRGTNLAGAETVLFGTKHGTHIVVVSSSELKVNSPKGRGTVSVRVVTKGGTSPQVTKDKFRYT